MTHHDEIAPKPRIGWRTPRLSGGFARLLATLAAWQVKARSRERLDRLPPELLRDVGLTPDAARDEASRPFWD
ncbi:MAG: DUF1127 domain-containing protein [Paracoccaceae bacterium]